MMDTPRSLVIREGAGTAAGSDRKHALVVASPSPWRSDLVRALKAAGVDVVVEGRSDPTSDWASDPSLDIVILDLSLAGRRALGALGPEDGREPTGPRIVLVTGERVADEVVENALTAAASGNGPSVRKRGDPGRYSLLVEEAKQRLLARDFPGALHRLEEAVDEDDRRPEAFNLLGVIEEVRGRRAEAQAHWRIALVLAPDYEPARENLRRLAQQPRLREGLALG